jgi:hypothetical protein
VLQFYFYFKDAAGSKPTYYLTVTGTPLKIAGSFTSKTSGKNDGGGGSGVGERGVQGGREEPTLQLHHRLKRRYSASTTVDVDLLLADYQKRHRLT